MKRILIVNDSVLHQKILLALLEQHGKYQCVGVAGDGITAIQMNQTYKPDLILMDIHMPNMDGVTATLNIMNSQPTRILIVTCTVTANLTHVFEAQAKGAMDAIKTPMVSLNSQGMLTPANMSKAGEELIHKIDTLLSANIPRGLSLAALQEQKQSLSTGLPAKKLVVIGASTGGPNAIVRILQEISELNDTAVLLVQHIDAVFAESFRLWLTEHTGLDATLAKADQPLQSNRIYVAPGGRQSVTIADDRTLKIIPTPEDRYYSPNIDLCMTSAANVFGHNALGIILTGMANDGAHGLLSMKEAGATTLSQSPESCVVDSMPRAAQQLGASQSVYPLAGISREIKQWIQKGGCNEYTRIHSSA
jgi:chemotaxis response regulator CheB